MKPSARWLIAVIAAVLAHLAWLQPTTTVSAAPRPRTVISVRQTAAPVQATTPPTPPVPLRRGGKPHATPPSGAPPASFLAPAPVVLDYVLRQGDAAVAMRLTWTPAHGRYQAALETTSADPHLKTWWRSEGGLGPDGLLPRRHTLKPSRKSEQALTILRLPEQTEVAFSTTEQRRATAPDVQDDLSWLPHWLGRWNATGHSVALQVAQTDGRVVALNLEPDPADRWHWLSSAAQQADDTVELWLSPTPPHWPLRWRRVTPWGRVTEWTAVPAPGPTPALLDVPEIP